MFGKVVLDCCANEKYSYRKFQGVLVRVIENHSCFSKSCMLNGKSSLIFCVYFICIDTNRKGTRCNSQKAQYTSLFMLYKILNHGSNHTLNLKSIISVLVIFS